MKIFYSASFEKKFRVFRYKDRAKEKIKIFLNNPFDEELDTHKLKGKFKRFYSLSVDYSTRIIFTFSKDSKPVYFHFIGNHDIYK